jgi:hypothetical protein
VDYYFPGDEASKSIMAWFRWIAGLDS